MATPELGTSGRLAMLMTDVEGSTALARRLGDRWAEVLLDHHRLVGGAIARHGGHVEGTEGDAFFALFDDPRAAGAAALEAQTDLAAHPWPPGVGALRVRMGLHVGRVARNATGLLGLEVHRTARIAAAAHGGQLLLSAAAADDGAVPRHALDALGEHRLKDFPVPERLFRARWDGADADPPPPRTLDARPSNLPPRAAPPVGRDDELTAIAEAAETARIVTITGRGGTGKTTLLLEAAHRRLDGAPGGVWWVPLAPLSDPAAVLPAIAEALRLDGASDVPQARALAERLADRGQVVLALDNLEHVAGCAPALQALLDAVPHLRLLVASQAPVGLPGERTVGLDGLAPDAALELVTRLARAVRPHADEDAGDRAALAELVALVDGLPLALELAAGRLGLLRPVALVERLRRSLDVAADPRAGRPERHRSLRATLEWTLSLLDPPTLALFTRFGAFAGGVELDDVEQLVGPEGLDALDGVQRLVDLHLVLLREPGDGRLLLDQPQALRRFAAERLDAEPDGPAVRRRHAEIQAEVQWAARTGPLARRSDRRRADALDGEAAAALTWAASCAPGTARRLAAAVALRRSDGGRPVEAAALATPVLQAEDVEPTTRALAELAVGHSALVLGDRAWASAAAARAADTAAAEGDLPLAAAALVFAGLAAALDGRDDEGVRLSTRARDLVAADPAASLGAETMLLQAQLLAGRLDDAEATEARVRSLARADVDARALDALESMAADLAGAAGRRVDALRHRARSLEGAEARGDLLQVLLDLQSLVPQLADAGADAAALETLGVAEALGAEVGRAAAGMADHLLEAPSVQAARARLGAAAAAARGAGLDVAPGRRVLRAVQLARLAAGPPDPGPTSAPSRQEAPAGGVDAERP